MLHNKTASEKRKQRIRSSLRKKALGKLRLSVFRSNYHIYAQIIDDNKGVTIVSASTLDKQFNGKKKSVTKGAASSIGKMIAERAAKNNISEVVFDRGSYIYHGRIKALADAARDSGLKF